MIFFILIVVIILSVLIVSFSEIEGDYDGIYEVDGLEIADAKVYIDANPFNLKSSSNEIEVLYGANNIEANLNFSRNKVLNSYMAINEIDFEYDAFIEIVGNDGDSNLIGCIDFQNSNHELVIKFIDFKQVISAKVIK